MHNIVDSAGWIPRSWILLIFYNCVCMCIYVCGGRVMATWWSSNFDRLGKLWCRSSFWCMRMIVADAWIFVSRKHKMKYISTLSHPAPLLTALAQVLLQRTPWNLAINLTIYHHYKVMILHVLSTFISWFCRVFFFPRSGWSAAFIAERLCHGFLAKIGSHSLANSKTVNCG